MKTKEFIGHIKRRVKIPEKVRIIFDVFEWVIFLFLVGLFILLLLPILPTKNSIASYIIPTGSMMPTIQVGSLAFVKPSAKTLSLQKGTIIAFTDPQNESITVLHRIVGVVRTGDTISYNTKGDNNNGKDPWEVAPAEIHGIYLFSIPYMGYLTGIVRSPLGFGFLIILPSLILILLQVKKIKEGIEEEVVRRTHLALEKKSISKEMLILIVGFGLLHYAFFHTIIQQAHALYTTSVALNNVGFSVKDYTSPQLFLDEDDSEKSLFYNLKHVDGYNSLSYFLTYDTDTVPEGVSGEIKLDGKNNFTSFPITLGTCSSGVCTYNKGIHNVELNVILHGNYQDKTLHESL